MADTLEFYFDFGSPTTYLAYTQIPSIARRTGANVDYKPFLLGGVFKATGNQSPVTNPAKAKWMLGDLALWAQRYGVPLAFNPHFPVNTLSIMRGAVAAQLDGGFEQYVDTMFTAMWVEQKNLGDPAVVAQVLGAAGIDAEKLLARSADPEVKAKLVANTEEAVARGAFGAPTFVVGKDLYFGQDRLEFIEERLKRGAG